MKTTKTLAHAIAVGNPVTGFKFYGPFHERPSSENESPLFDLAAELAFDADAPDGATVVDLLALPDGPEAEGVDEVGAPMDLARRLAAFAAEVLDLEPEAVAERAKVLADDARAAGLLP